MFPIPPKAYGGIERVVYDVTEGLVAAGHTVTLFAPTGSRSSGQLIETGSAGVGLDHDEEAKHDHFLRNGRAAYAQAALLGDLVHDHTDFTRSRLSPPDRADDSWTGGRSPRRHVRGDERAG